MDYSTILSSATKLKRNSLYKVTISEYCKEILLQLNTLISNAYDVGLTNIDYKLPINFKRVDDSVSNQELQTAIYYNLVTELETKQYDVKLQFFKHYTLLKVSWAVKADIKDLERMHDKLMSISE